MKISGKGFFIWRISAIRNGDLETIAKASEWRNLNHVVIKVADRHYKYNIYNGTDMVPPLINLLRQRGIQVWGWHYVYGSHPEEEADRAAQRIQELGLDGYVINAEKEFKATGMASEARKFMRRLRSKVSNVPLALSTYRYPSVHPDFPITAFDPYIDVWMPQVYWQAATNPAYQLNKSYTEYSQIGHERPYIPTGAAYSAGSWTPTGGQITEFLTEVHKMNLSAANFWEWGAADVIGRDVWRAVRLFNWKKGTSTYKPLPSNNYSESEKASRLDELAVTNQYLSNRYNSLSGDDRRNEIERIRNFINRRESMINS